MTSPNLVAESEIDWSQLAVTANLWLTHGNNSARRDATMHYTALSAPCWPVVVFLANFATQYLFKLRSFVRE